MPDQVTTPEPTIAPLAAITDGTSPATTWQEQDGLLRELWMENKSPQAIATVLNRSVSAIMTRAARLGLPRRAAPGRKPRPQLPQDKDMTATARPAVTRRTVPKGSVTSDASEQSTQTAPRICLMCLTTFQSVGRHNRICSSCKNSSEYISASTLADIHLPQT